MGLCEEPCELANVCAPSAKCKSKMHRPICYCPEGHEGNPTLNCTKISLSKLIYIKKLINIVAEI